MGGGGGNGVWIGRELGRRAGGVSRGQNGIKEEGGKGEKRGRCG